MTLEANIGAERPSPSPRTGSSMPGLPRSGGQDDQPLQHSPEAEGLLRRYLSEIHSYRQLGNAALRELEVRLEALTGEPGHAAPSARAPASTLMRPSVERPDPSPEQSAALDDRLRELSTYLHADLTKQQQEPRHAAPIERPARQRYAPSNDAAPQAPRHAAPTAPVLDRLWFEERFAEMRTSIGQVAEQIPTARLDALELQFHALMETLGAREAERSMAPVEAGLKKLAAYLEDNRHWTVAHDARVQGMEARLDQLSGLVAQSHAAIAATATGLEIVARGTGPELARATANLVASELEKRLGELNPSGAITELSRDVANLSAQSTQLARTTGERLRQLQICLDESIDRLNEEARDAAQPTPASNFDAETYEEDDEFDDDDDLTASQRAARLSDHTTRAMPQQGEPVRYQIPYGEFLPDEDRGHSRTGLVVAAVILVLASAAMLYLNLRDRHAPEARPKPAAAYTAPTREIIVPVTTSSIPAAKTSERISQSAKRGAMQPSELWATNVASDGDRSAPATAAPAADVAPAPAAETQAPEAESLRKAAVKGDANAQFSIGEGYLEGRDSEQPLPVSERLSKAARWFRRAAENGHAPSEYRLATLYEMGQGAPKDVGEAMRWYERAAEKGHVKAMHNLAVLSIIGSGKSADYLASAKWFAKAAESGLRDSQYNLAILYERGFGVEKDAAKAYQWYTLAAKAGDANAAAKRDELARTLPDADRKSAERTLALWAAAPVDEAVNRVAPEPPVEEVRKAEAAIEPKAPSAQIMKTAWSTDIAPRNNNLVAEAQRLLGRLGYKPGPADGVMGRRTEAAIREFEKRIGLRPTGQVNEALLARMAFAEL